LLELVGAALVMGLVGSPHCIGMCGPFALACSGRPAHVAGWQLGKLTTYALLGAVAGTFGSVIPGPAWLAQIVSACLIVWFAAAMAGFVPEPSLHIPGVTRLATQAATRNDLRSRVAFGAANGLLPCGLVYAAVGLAVAAGSPLAGALVMATFGLGTAPVLTTFALSARTLLTRRPGARRALAFVISIAGVWVVVRRGGMPPPMP
jgi:sulfite exporter TauE/SafE